MALTVATLTAPAKLTRTLRITGVRADGYHLLDSEMVTLALHDTLVVEPADTSALTLDGIPLPDDGAENLVLKALRAAGRTAHVRLTKRIPSGAGLGGGSADAAAILRWSGVLDTAVAARLGADVPFCVVGGGRARVRGIGEQVDPLPIGELEGRPVTLLTPPIHVSTPAVYRAWDALPAHQQGAEGPNDLEPAALVVAPELARWRDELGAATGATPVLAGSGATWFVEGSYPDVRIDGVATVVTRIAAP